MKQTIQFVFFVFLYLIKYSEEGKFINPKCNGLSNPTESCCTETMHILALATASTKAVTHTLATAQASVMASAGVTVSATVAAAATAQAAVTHSIAISLNTGTCCQISASAQADAKACAKAVSNATAEAQAQASAAANASALAVSYAQSAASIYTLAETLLNSSCCNFSVEVYNAVRIVGKYTANATAIANISDYVAVQAQVAVSAAANAAARAAVSAQALANVSIDNCCVDSKTQVIVKDTAVAASVVSDYAKSLTGLSSSALSSIVSVALDTNTIKNTANLISAVCASECGSASISCCKSTKQTCCSPQNEGGCLTSQALSRAYLYVSSIAQSVAATSSWVNVSVQAMAEASVKASAAAVAAVNAKVSVKVQVFNCCSIFVQVQTQASAYAIAVSSAIAKAKAAAWAYAGAGTLAYGISVATSLAVSSGKSIAKVLNDGCCDTPCCGETTFYPHPTYKCCQVVSAASQAFYSSYDKAVESTLARSVDSISGGIKAAILVREDAIKTLFAQTSTTKNITLSCCCCNPATTTTKSNVVG